MAPKDPTTYNKPKNNQGTALFWPLEFLIHQICMKTGELLGLYELYIGNQILQKFENISDPLAGK